MNQLIISDMAKSDLREIWRYIAGDNLTAADRLLEAVYGEFELLRTQPMIGRKRDELFPGLRSFPFSSYVIFYQETEHRVEIFRVLSSYRDVRRLF